MFRSITTLAFGAALLAAVAASATNLSVTPQTLQAGSAELSDCDADGVTLAYNVAWDAADSRYEVSSVTVSDISDDCDGKTLKVTLVDAGNNSLAEGTIGIANAANDFDEIVATAASPAAEDVTAAHATIYSAP